MSDSYPTIQDYLSDVERDFMGCVEVHLDPPEGDTTTYEVEALYRCDVEDGVLPGNGVRFVVSVDETDPEISARRHLIEFVSLDDPNKPLGRVMHAMKRIEAWHGRFFWTESRFQVQTPDFPDEQANGEIVEREVVSYVDRVRALDRERKLVEVAA